MSEKRFPIHYFNYDFCLKLKSWSSVKANEQSIGEKYFFEHKTCVFSLIHTCCIVVLLRMSHIFPLFTPNVEFRMKLTQFIGGNEFNYQFSPFIPTLHMQKKSGKAIKFLQVEIFWKMKSRHSQKCWNFLLNPHYHVWS